MKSICVFPWAGTALSLGFKWDNLSMVFIRKGRDKGDSQRPNDGNKDEDTESEEDLADIHQRCANPAEKFNYAYILISFTSSIPK